ncbi:hypothetical protein CC2G_014378 [Coprinopsis cinerea AmutBmut pab1-1]|nr:hypothetical protein CC2G_014378 [Coprinopsis cinerea AmutBmut pab1-1]
MANEWRLIESGPRADIDLLTLARSHSEASPYLWTTIAARTLALVDLPVHTLVQLDHPDGPRVINRLDPSTTVDYVYTVPRLMKINPEPCVIVNLILSDNSYLRAPKLSDLVCDETVQRLKVSVEGARVHRKSK